MLRLGLTGGIAAGKSTVVTMLKQWNVPVFDADQTVHQLYRLPSIITSVRTLCPEAVDSGHQVNRKILSDYIKKYPALLPEIERLIHPLIRHAEQRFMIQHGRQGRIVACADIPLLFEGGNEQRFDIIWLVTAPLWLRKKRVMRRKTMSETTLEQIICRQWNDNRKKALADRIIYSGIGKAFMAQQVKSYYEELIQGKL